MEFNLGIFPASACASRPYVFNHTTEEAFFFTSMLIPPASPPHHRSMSCPDARYTTLGRIILRNPSRKLLYAVTWKGRTTAPRSEAGARADVIDLTHGGHKAACCHHCSFMSRRGGFVLSNVAQKSKIERLLATQGGPFQRGGRSRTGLPAMEGRFWWRDVSIHL